MFSILAMGDPNQTSEFSEIISAGWYQGYKDWLMDLEYSNLLLVRIGVFAAVAVIAWLVTLFTKTLVLRAIRAIAKKTSNKWDNCLIENRFFQRLSHIAPAIVFYASIPLVFAGYEAGAAKMQLGVYLYFVVIGLLVVDAFLNSVVDIYQTFEFARRMPIKGFVQVIKIIVSILAIISILAIVLEKDPTKLLAGMGALTAVLLLIFKDSILGFVAGIQLSTNNMVHIGDWIEMGKYGADGDVIDITLTTVKVQNWDKTISTIPAYALVSDSFKNWRGMSESAGRRIKRSVSIDMNSIKFCDEQMLDRFGKFSLIRDYLGEKKKELAEYNAQNNIDDSVLVNGRRLTNIGTFRAYVAAYLRSHPMVNKDMTFLVRQLEPTPQGLPIQVYVFCSDKVWANYEGIQSDIFDHILAVVPQFDLKVYQQPAGSDFSGGFVIRSQDS